MYPVTAKRGIGQSGTHKQLPVHPLISFLSQQGPGSLAFTLTVLWATGAPRPRPTAQLTHGKLPAREPRGVL